ncbi:cell division protein FtsW [Priestia endophytica]|uniref:FtsW/RodA/SpoVE family cell cycle protein n=1 Tax=Priestia endophytica TaxID=135735 RepID=UPI000DCA5A36|nr:cell division protein FtsW [Priestia endophytica]
MFKKMFRNYDYSIIIALVLLCSIGLVMVYSASVITAVSRYDFAADHFYQRQKLSLIIGALVFFVTMIIPYQLYARFIKGILALVVVGLFLVSLFGHVSGNAASWLRIGGLSIQPSEFVKLAIVLYLAMVLEKRQPYLNDFKRAFTGPVLIVIFLTGLIALEPDFGTAMIVLGIAVAVLLCSGINKYTFRKFLALGLGSILVVLPIAWMTGYISPTRIARVTTTLDPFKDAAGEGYQLVNAYIAMGSGGFFGAGLGQSVQKYGYLPESHTDAIIAIIAEELGFVGVATVLFLLAFIIIKTLLLAKKCQDVYGSLICIGIATTIGIQAFFNLGGITGVIPLTGVPLPFVSYGGTSILLLLASMGIVVNISMFTNYRSKKAEGEESPLRAVDSKTERSF